jgi:hypothetical protein
VVAGNVDDILHVSPSSVPPEGHEKLIVAGYIPLLTQVFVALLNVPLAQDGSPSHLFVTTLYDVPAGHSGVFSHLFLPALYV